MNTWVSYRCSSPSIAQSLSEGGAKVQRFFNRVRMEVPAIDSLSPQVSIERIDCVILRPEAATSGPG